MLTNISRKISINSLNFYLTKDKIKFRSMHKSVNKVVNLQLIKGISDSLKMQTRGMACYHGGNFKFRAPKPKVNDTDTSRLHKIVAKTTCAENNCKTVNCADANDVNAQCPGRTAQQNQTSIPPTSQGFKTEVSGNLTTQVPWNKNGFVVDHTTNYCGQNKVQEMVVESNPPVINSKDFNVDNKSTQFVQNHHNILEKNIP